MTSSPPAIDLLIGSVGFNPASLLIASRTLRPRAVLLICTQKTGPVANVVSAQIGVPSTIVEWPLNPSIDETRRELRALPELAQGLGSVCLDVTGATKPLCIGIWSALDQLYGDRLQSVYLEPDGQLVDARRGGPIPGADVVITPEEFLAQNGATVQEVRHESLSDALTPAVREREALTRYVVEGLASRRVKIEHGAPLAVVSNQRLPAMVPPGFRVERSRIIDGSRGDYFLRGTWLEEYAALVAAEVTENLSDVRAKTGLKLLARGEITGTGQDEVDIVLTRGARVVVVEAKGRHDSAGAGADILKRAQKAARFFGQLSKLVFVHPAWGLKPPADLVPLVGRSVTLVGSDPVALREALRRGLGLPV